jgi:hypothetical protein
MFLPTLHTKIDAINEYRANQILEGASLKKQKEKLAKKDL